MQGAGLTVYSIWDELKKWVVSVIVILIAIYLLINRGTFMWIDNVDLVIHEAGHLFFFFFGRFVYTLGGTLMQLIIPLLIAHTFWRNNYRTGTQAGLLWMGQNFINISVYAADAVARKLPLLGGKKVYHDWNYMLSELGLLGYAAEIGYLFVGCACIVFLISFLMPLFNRE